jgi:hypothetical protein
VRLLAAAKGNMERAVGLAFGSIFAIARQQTRIFGSSDRHADMTRSQQV